MTPQEKLRHIFAFELQQVLTGAPPENISVVLQRGARATGWQALLAALPGLLKLPAEQLLHRMASWVPLLKTGVFPVLTGPETREQPAAKTLAAGPAPSRSEARGSGQDVRVSLQQLESLFAHAGELTVLKNRLEEHLRSLQTLESHLSVTDREVLNRFTDAVRLLRQDHFDLNRISEELTSEVIDLRLRPASLMVTPLERLVRDLTQSQGKKVQFQVQGSDTELDRNLLDPLRDALMHLIRNAIDHGLETPAERKKAQKTETGQLELTILSRGESIHLTLQDDGQGIQQERVRQKALERGLIQEGTVLSEEQVYDLLFRPGFSTAQQVSAISGRGVGLDAVRANLDLLGGEVWLTSAAGQGTTFHLRVPQTLATTRAFVLMVSGQMFAVPSRHVDRIVKPEKFTLIDQKRTIEWQGAAIPTFDLSEMLGLPSGAASITLILNLADRCVGVNVQNVLSEEEFVIKPLPWGIPSTTAFQGVVMNRSGALVPVLNVSQLSEHARPRTLVQPQTSKRQQRILVADDSVAVRTIQRSILEMAGFEVQVAENGRIALGLLRQSAFDLLVSDIEMPEMTGLELTRNIRLDERLKHLPVILVTSMASPHHQEEGMLAGADAYLIKGNYAPEDLLDTIGRLI
ncbi:hybrid sensor histidine kinase/response regulator [Deinococcus roseus]|uniref:histidine kinase n=1 Tax=Deinococcus roseus TaxID=392414 RepID=A0ABQ2D0M1_9DEIO|nr:response regulator [Deinococcus roseus]GGJ39234.1 hybrid sensor histidine kinase/response regulator [Deinococcus roseus]